MTNPSVLVTGSSRGIGRAIALRLARDGYDVTVHCRARREEAESVADAVRACGRKSRVVCFDVAHREEGGRSRRLAEELERRPARRLDCVRPAGANRALVPRVAQSLPVAGEALRRDLEDERTVGVDRGDERKHADAPVPEPA